MTVDSVLATTGRRRGNSERRYGHTRKLSWLLTHTTFAAARDCPPATSGSKNNWDATVLTSCGSGRSCSVRRMPQRQSIPDFIPAFQFSAT